jgi:hypothetical protein
LLLFNFVQKKNEKKLFQEQQSSAAEQNSEIGRNCEAIQVQQSIETQSKGFQKHQRPNTGFGRLSPRRSGSAEIRTYKRTQDSKEYETIGLFSVEIKNSADSKGLGLDSRSAL